jgi:tight adherence protein C
MNEQVLAAAAAALFGGAIALAILVFVMHRLNRDLLERLQHTVSATNPMAPVDVTSDVSGVLGLLVRVARTLRAFAPFEDAMDRLTPPARYQMLNQKLEAAGMREYLAPRDLSEAQLVGSIGGFTIMMIVGGPSPKTLVFAVMIAAVMYRLSLVPVTNAIQQRQDRIRGALPKCADILVVAVEAGMTLDRALTLYAERFGGPLSDELRRIQEDMKVGHRRREAFQAAMARVNLEDLSRFLSAVLLAERFGVPVAMVLRDQSEALKQQRVLRIREASMKAPIKMLIPTVALILPALLIILLGPLVVIMLSGGMFG